MSERPSDRIGVVTKPLVTGKSGQLLRRSARLLPGPVRDTIVRLWFDRKILSGPDRKYLERRLVPYLHQRGSKNVLFVGCRAYTSHYSRLFQAYGMTLFTCDIDPVAARYGSPGHHQTINALDLTPDCFPVRLDTVVFSGVLGFGLDGEAQATQAGRVFGELLMPGATLVLGWNADRSIDPITNPVWQGLFKRTEHLDMAKRVTFPNSTHIFDILERRGPPAVNSGPT